MKKYLKENKTDELAASKFFIDNILVNQQLKTMPNIFSRGLIYLVVCFVIIFFVFILIFKLDIVVESISVARPFLDKLGVVSKKNGYIDQCYVYEGIFVKKGDPLFVIRYKDKNKDKKESSQSDNHKANEFDIIKSQVDGTVLKVFFKTFNDYVKKDDLICWIIPESNNFYMDIIVKNKDIGFVANNLKIKYKFDAFPHNNYGFLSGRILSISPSAVENKDLGFIYHVKGNLTKNYFTIKKKKYYIKVGMTATAEIVTGKKSIFSILFKRIEKKYENNKKISLDGSF